LTELTRIDVDGVYALGCGQRRRPVSRISRFA
jgi:hypothetical protein